MRSRRRIDRRPGKLLVAVAAARAPSSAISRPRWRALGARIEGAELARGEREAFRELLELVDRRANVLLAEHRLGGVSHPFLDGLIALCRRREAWIREPRAWRARSHNPARQFAALCRHLLARYPVPAFLDAAWLRRDARAEQYRDWYLWIGQGENLRHTDAPVPLTKRIVHHFLRAPETCSVEQALRWGQVRALGGEPPLAAAVVATRVGEHLEHTEFWTQRVPVPGRSPGDPGHQVGPILDYLQHQRFEPEEVFTARGTRARRPPARPNLSMRGRESAALLREVERWHRQLGRAGRMDERPWPPSGISGFELEARARDGSARVWRIRELRSTAELRAEGRAMRNCVASYASWCRQGSCSIWSLELHSSEGVQRRQTIEVRPGREIIQSRGRANAQPKPQELDLLRRWAVREGLTIAAHVRSA